MLRMTAHDAEGELSSTADGVVLVLQVQAEDIIFWGLRVRMCVASGICEGKRVCSDVLCPCWVCVQKDFSSRSDMHSRTLRRLLTCIWADVFDSACGRR